MPAPRGSSRPSQPEGAPSASADPAGPDEALRTLIDLAGDVARIGCFDWDLQTGSLSWDARMRRLLEVDASIPASFEALTERIVPSDVPAVRQAIIETLKQGTDLHVDLRLIDRIGATRWLAVSARPVVGDDGRTHRLLGVGYENSQVHEDREQAARALDTMPTPYAIVDRDWTIRYLNQAGRHLVGSPVEPVGMPIWDVVPGMDNPTVSTLLRKVMDERESMTLEIPSGRNLAVSFEVSAQPVANGVAVLVHDVTARRQAQAEASRAAERVALLAQAGSTLVQRRPLLETVQAGLDLLVPHLAYAATIYLHESGAGLRLISTRHVDRSAQDDLHRFFAGLPISVNDPATATGRAMLSGQSAVIGRISQEFVERATADPALRARILALHETGVIAVPMVSRGESIGLIGLMGLHGRTPDGADLVLIEDIASRIAAAIDNAQILIQVQQARQTAELATRRLEFHASVTDALGSTLDGVEAARRLVRMLVPSLGTFAMVTLLDEDATVSHCFGAHESPALQPLLDRYTETRRHSLVVQPEPLDQVLGAGSTYHRYTLEEFAARVGDEDSTRALQGLNAGTVTALPILARDRPLGIISLYNSPERGPLNETDLDSAREVARRAGLVLDNARLYARSQSMAVTLQRSLLTEAVSNRDLQVETRYLPAVADAQVGGDWYDAFRTGQGATTLVIGDVMGHDTEAAALMGQLRTMVRTVCVDRAEPPSGVLRRVDEVAQELGLDTTATAVVAEIMPAQRTASDPSAPRVTGHRMRWSNAGHPPPVLLTPDGRVSILSTSADLLLGLGADVPRADHLLDLPPGSTVLMFTDGLVEGRSLPIDVGLRRLGATAGPLAGLPLPELCDELLAGLVAPSGAEDDIALVAVRVLPSAVGG